MKTSMEVATLEHKLAVLERRIRKGCEHLLWATPKLQPALQAKLKGWSTERERLLATLSGGTATNNGTKTTTASPTPACAYIRSGTGDRRALKNERALLRQFAKKIGCRIIKWYSDVGSGAAPPDKRPAFSQMLADAPTAEWVVILCHHSRFSRLDSIESASAMQILKAAGKKFRTVTEGVYDWATPTGRILDKCRRKACAYVRTSLERSADSPAIQRECIVALAEREGYDINRWYADVGVSGSRLSAKRSAWWQLLADAPTAEWEVVLAYDRSRFSRLDSIEEGFAKQTLREAGKKLHTVVEGQLDWDTSAGRLTSALQPEIADQYAVTLAQRVLEGMRIAFPNGRFLGRKCPYGMARRVVDPQGHQHIVPRKQNFLTPRGWSQSLMPGEKHEVETVRWLFATFAKKGVGFSGLARQLNAKSCLSPNGLQWTAPVVHRLLTNVIYVGDICFGRMTSGKFARLDGNRVVRPVYGSRPAKQEGLIRREAHKGIIDRALWEQVQAILNRRPRQGNPEQ